MSDGILSKAATMEIPISSNGDTSSLPEDDGLEQVRGLGTSGECLGLYQAVLSLHLSPLCFSACQDLQQVMVSGPNLNETSIVSGGYGGTAEGIIPTGTIKGIGAGQEWGSSGEEGAQLSSLPLTYDTRLCHSPAKVSLGWALFPLDSGSLQGQRGGVCWWQRRGCCPSSALPGLG